jgi:formate dehydrogenase maturation protein FdhE
VSARYHGDCCPACGSHQVTPYAVIVGATEEYGYQCQVCDVMWPVMIYAGSSATDPAGHKPGPAA